MSNQNPNVAAIERIGNATIEAVDSLAERVREVPELRSRVEALEAGWDRPKGTQGERFDKDHAEHREVFLKWMRRPHDGSMRRQLDEAQSEIEAKGQREGKNVTIGSDPGGGYAVPALIASEVEARVRVLNPFRSIARVVKAGSSDYAHLVSTNSATSGWVAEDASRTATGTSDLIQRKPTFGVLYAYPSATEEALQDIFFDVGAWLVEEIADGFSAAEATAFISGNGSARPTGFTVDAAATADDASPERAAGALQYLTLDGSPPALDADKLIEMSLSIKDRYLLDAANVAWVMARGTAAMISKLKTSTGGDYLWQPALQAGMPNMLLGHPVYLSDAMPAATENQFPIAFGNWRRGYVIADRSEMMLTVDSNITTPGRTKYYARQRIGGCVLNHEAVRLLRYAAS